MENIKMKKILGIIILSVFVISIMATASPVFKTEVQNLKNSPKYASSHLPVPQAIELNQNLAGADKDNSEKFANFNTDLNLQIQDIKITE
jgi:hypothetical protein